MMSIQGIAQSILESMGDRPIRGRRRLFFFFFIFVFVAAIAVAKLLGIKICLYYPVLGYSDRKVLFSKDFQNGF